MDSTSLIQSSKTSPERVRNASFISLGSILASAIADCNATPIGPTFVERCAFLQMVEIFLICQSLINFLTVSLAGKTSFGTVNGSVIDDKSGTPQAFINLLACKTVNINL